MSSEAGGAKASPVLTNPETKGTSHERIEAASSRGADPPHPRVPVVRLARRRLPVQADLPGVRVVGEGQQADKEDVPDARRREVVGRGRTGCDPAGRVAVALTDEP